MPLANFKSIKQVSSEDSIHLASNLLPSNQTGKKWKTKNTSEKAAYVIIELSEEYFITGIDIGNEHSAFVEVLVGKANQSSEHFKEILITSSFMTPIESRNSSNVNRVRCFSKGDLVDSVVSQKWQIIKVICTQPFNKHVQYGLSFIKIHAEENIQIPLKNFMTDSKLSSIGSFMLKEDSPESESETSKGLFMRWKESRLKDLDCKEVEEHMKQKIEKTSTIYDKTKNKLVIREEEKNVNQRLDSHILKDRESLLVEEEKQKTVNKKDLIADKMYPQNSSKLTEKENSTKKHRKLSPKMQSEKKAKVIKYVPFKNLLRGVVLVISGIQNPDRANLRRKALDMGAVYKTDWDNTCTHLLCAFKNTPKYHQVKGAGKIVKRTWIEECFHLKKRLPWRRFAIDDKELDKNESEEEILADDLKLNSANSSIKSSLEKIKSDQTLALYDLDYENLKAKSPLGSETDDDISNNEREKLVELENDDAYDKSTEEEDVEYH